MKTLQEHKFYKLSLYVGKVMIFIAFFSAFGYSQNLQTDWLIPIRTPYQVEKHHKLELGIQLPLRIQRQIRAFQNDNDAGLNPYNPEDIDLQVELISPKGDTITRFAFYYESFKRDSIRDTYTPEKTLYHWLFRFAPSIEGAWTGKITLYTKGEQQREPAFFNFDCTSSNHKGKLLAKEGERLLVFEENNEPFFASGVNVSHGGFCHYRPSEHLRHKKGIEELARVGGNFTRFELGGQGPLPDWPNYRDYSSKLGEMEAFDQIVSLCEEKDIYFILFRHHVEVMDEGDPNKSAWNGISWFDNPYRIPFELNSVQEYFESKEVLKWQKNALRYIYARWGYSTSFSFYGFSEIDNWISKIWHDKDQNRRLDGGDLKQRPALSLFKDWVSEQQNYVLEELNPNAQFIHSYANTPSIELKKRRTPGFFELSDVVAVHDYAENKNSNYGRRFSTMKNAWSRYKKPLLIEEMGVNRVSIYCCTGIEFHNSIWATSMMGGIGTGMDWWWDRGVFDFDYHQGLIEFNQFFDTLNFDFHSIHQWQDNRSRNGKRRNIENLFTLDKEKKNGLGWVHNARFYWRNLSAIDSCVAHLVKTDSLPGSCLVAHNPYRTTRYEGNGDFCYPNEYHDIGNERFYDFDNLRYTDKYTGMSDLSIGGNADKRTFKVKHLKSRFLPWVHAKKHWYKISFYSTTDNPEMKEELMYRQIVSTSVFGNLTVQLPTLDEKNTDYAYKIEYLGLKKQEEVIPRTISNLSW